MAFGQEKLYGFMQKVIQGTTTRIVFSGDSTTFGTAFATSKWDPAYLFQQILNADNISTVSALNYGISGATTVQWNTTYVANQIALAADLYVLRWGLNDAGSGDVCTCVSTFATALRGGLAQMRAALPISGGTGIVLMMPNSAYQNAGGPKNEIYFEELRKVCERAALDYQCAFFDTYGLFQDSYDAGGLYMDGTYNVFSLHPWSTMEESITSALYDFIMPTHIRTAFSSMNKQTQVYSTPTGSTFHVLGTTLNADYSTALKTYNTKTGVFFVQSNKIYCTGAGSLGWLIGTGADGGNTGCLRFRYSPAYTGNPATRNDIITIQSSLTSTVDLLQFSHDTNGNLTLTVNDSAGAVICPNDTLYAWAAVAASEYEFELNWNFTTGSTLLLINGIYVGNTLAHTGTRTGGGELMICSPTTTAAVQYYYGISLWATAQHTTAGYAYRTASRTTIAGPNITTDIVSLQNVVLPFSTLAAAGTTQGTAALITSFVTLVSSGTGGVIIPTSAVAGNVFTIINRTANAISVYPYLGQGIDGGTANIPVSLSSNCAVSFCYSPPWFYTVTTANPAVSMPAITALGNSQGTAALITANAVMVTGTLGTGVIFPVPVNGTTFTVINGSAVYLFLYPCSTQGIDGGSANSAVVLEPNSTSVYIYKAPYFYTMSIAKNYAPLQPISAAGNSQGTATAITCETVLVTAGTVGQGIVLPGGNAKIGMKIVIYSDLTVTINLYPSTGKGFSVNGGSDTPITLYGKSSISVVFKDPWWYITNNTASQPSLIETSVPIYANNGAAVTGGLPVGAHYRTNADPDLLCIVH